MSPLFGRQSKTPAEQLAACVAAIDGLSELSPRELTYPPFWDAKKHGQIESLRSLPDVESVRGAAQMFPLTFAAFRNHVHDHEAQNAARLCVLVWVAREMFALRADAELSNKAGSMYDRVTRAIEHAWKQDPSDIPMRTPYRLWCSRVTRDHRALPLAWRHV